MYSVCSIPISPSSTWEVKAGGWRVQRQLCLHSEPEARLRHMKSCLRTMQLQDWGDVSVHKITRSWRRPGFSSQRPRGDAPPSLAPFPGHLILSSKLHDHYSYTQCTYTHIGKTLIHTNKSKTKTKTHQHKWNKRVSPTFIYWSKASNSVSSFQLLRLQRRMVWALLSNLGLGCLPYLERHVGSTEVS